MTPMKSSTFEFLTAEVHLPAQTEVSCSWALWRVRARRPAWQSPLSFNSSHLVQEAGVVKAWNLLALGYTRMSGCSAKAKRVAVHTGHGHLQRLGWHGFRQDLCRFVFYVAARHSCNSCGRGLGGATNISDVRPGRCGPVRRHAN